jgi:hypothetical protein
MNRSYDNGKDVLSDAFGFMDLRFISRLTCINVECIDKLV